MKKIATRYRDSISVKLHFGEEVSRTKQQFKQECDMNFIVGKAQKAGMERELFKQPGWNEVMLPDALDYQESLNQVVAAQEMFMRLPAKVRGRFGNDPQAFLEFASNPAENGEEMIRLGLATRKDMEKAGNAVPAPEKGKKEEPKAPKKNPQKAEPSED